MNMDVDRPVPALAANQPAGGGIIMLRFSGLPARLAWTMGLLSTLLFAASVFLPLISNSTSFFDNLLVNTLGTPTLLVYATVDAIIAARHPANAIGWIFCGAAFIVAFDSF